MNKVTFSLIIPTYNRSKSLKEAILSALDQQYPPLEIIVVDDGSTDDTKAIVNALNHGKIRYFYKENEERAVARNFGVAQAQGDYCTFLDSDDILYKNHFSEAKKMVILYENIEIFHLAYEITTPTGEVLKQYIKKEGSLNNDLYYGNRMSCAGVFIRKDVAKANLFCTNPNLICTEDWELWLRLGAQYTWKYNSVITSALINHSHRSVSRVDKTKLVNRLNALIINLKKDYYFNKNCIEYLPIIKTNMMLYVALHLAIANQKPSAIKYLYLALKTKFILCWQQRIFYGTIKKIIF